MNSTLSAIILVICVVFTTYKLGQHFFSRKSSKSLSKVVIKKSTFDKRFYSTPSFDFPNTQSESDMKFIDFRSDWNEQHDKLKVTQYYKY